MIGALTFGHLPIGFIPAGPKPTGKSNSQKSDTRKKFANGEVDRSALISSEQAHIILPVLVLFMEQLTQIN